MKIIALLFAVSMSCFASDTLTVSKTRLLKSISAQHEQTQRKFQASLTSDQLQLQKQMQSLETQHEAFQRIAQDSIKVTK